MYYIYVCMCVTGEGACTLGRNNKRLTFWSTGSRIDFTRLAGPLSTQEFQEGGPVVDGWMTAQGVSRKSTGCPFRTGATRIELFLNWRGLINYTDVSEYTDWLYRLLWVHWLYTDYSEYTDSIPTTLSTLTLCASAGSLFIHRKKGKGCSTLCLECNN